MNNLCEVRPAGIADIPAIRSLTAITWPPTYEAIIGEAQVAYMLDLFYSPEALARQMQSEGHFFGLALVDGEAVGFASFSEVEPAVCKLHKLYVLPTVQGRGVGRCLMDFVVEGVRRNGGTRLILNVNRYNTPAIRFYERAGFGVLRDEDIDIGGGFFMNDHVLYTDL